jgi:hypothetical protein
VGSPEPWFKLLILFDVSSLLETLNGKQKDGKQVFRLYA